MKTNFVETKKNMIMTFIACLFVQSVCIIIIYKPKKKKLHFYNDWLLIIVDFIFIFTFDIFAYLHISIHILR